MTFAKLLALTAVLLPLSAVAQSNHSAKPSFTLPKAGTRFVNSYYVTDSAGHIVPDTTVQSSIEDDTLYVIRSDIRVRGREHCIALSGPAHPDTTWLSFAKNGDVWILRSDRKTPWDRLPFGLPTGHTEKTKPKVDEGHILGRDYTMMYHKESTVLGHDTNYLAGVKYDCIKMQDVEIRRYQESDFKNAITYWFVPALGYYTHVSWGWNGSYFLHQQVKNIRMP